MQSTLSGERDHISFRERLSEDPAPPLAQHKMPFGNLLIPESVE